MLKKIISHQLITIFTKSTTISFLNCYLTVNGEQFFNCQSLTARLLKFSFYIRANELDCFSNLVKTNELTGPSSRC